MKPTRNDGLTFDAGRAFRIPEMPGTPLPRRTFVATYYDTSDHRLARAESLSAGASSGASIIGTSISCMAGLASSSASAEHPGAPLETLRRLLPIYTRGAELVPSPRWQLAARA